MILTYLDTGVLIAASRQTTKAGETALELLQCPKREFVTSDMLELELLPKARFHGKTAEVEFYENFFSTAVLHLKTTPELVQNAVTLATRYGLAACDAMHISIAITSGCTELITTEKNVKPMFRVQFPLLSLHSISE